MRNLCKLGHVTLLGRKLPENLKAKMGTFYFKPNLEFWVLDRSQGL